ncbi:hypothetical protein ETD86_32320 [Nonomuraea turkmeniaca]|uniref:Uncharacterized protein n=1 Tax=Nonomuraea turkmeniaca TaxID=103838 RepID=A0A5S4F7U5_9ACTN|nr:hypothetical protein [Nonomuraea turkmeniaca]TMR12654.1 hypothetical protein ETD86_32320 [Nonomuraea turkmeniaca]
MTAVIVSLVAVVLLVLVVVALGVRSMNRRESSLPPERLKEMAEKEEKTHARSTDEFAAHEPRMNNFSPDFSPIDAPKAPKPVRTGQRGKRGVDEWGNPTSDDEDEEFWANIRSDAEQGNFGAGGTVAARKAAARPGDREREPQRAAELPSRSERRSERTASPQPVAAADPDATTVQAPLPQRQPAPAAASNLADLVEPANRATRSQPDLADQRTVTFAAPTADVMSILGAGAQPVVPASRPEPMPSPRPQPTAANGTGAFANGNGSYANGGSSFASSNGTGSYPASPANGSGSFPASPSAGGSGAFPAAGPTSSGSFPIAQPAPLHGAPTSDPFPAYNGAADPLETTWTTPPTPSVSGSWPATVSPDILDDPTPAPSYDLGSSWPAFEQPAARSSYPASYEVRPGWAVADDSDALTGPSPVTGAPTTPRRAVSANYDDVLSTPTPPAPPSAYPAYETGDITTAPAAAWPEPPSPNGTQSTWPGYGGDMFGNQPQASNGSGNGHRHPSEQDYPHDYYR